MFDFQKQVIEASFQKPILVDFWAPWCGPCRILGPVLERLAAEQIDRWTLVKLNTEEHPELAEEYKIRSIPNVKLFHQGREIAEFVGALPQSRIEKWLDENLPNPASQQLQAILDSAKGIPDKNMVSKLRRFIDEHPDDQEAKLALARHTVYHAPDEARSLVEGIFEDNPSFDVAEDVRNLADFFSFHLDNGTLAGDRLQEAQLALRNNDPEVAIEKIIEATLIDKNYHDELPRRAAIALFRTWGNEHELTRKFRRQFDMALY
jgi:putative thioredoxin